MINEEEKPEKAYLSLDSFKPLLNGVASKVSSAAKQAQA